MANVLLPVFFQSASRVNTCRYLVYTWKKVFLDRSAYIQDREAIFHAYTMYLCTLPASRQMHRRGAFFHVYSKKPCNMPAGRHTDGLSARHMNTRYIPCRLVGRSADTQERPFSMHITSFYLACRKDGRSVVRHTDRQSASHTGLDVYLSIWAIRQYRVFGRSLD